MIHNYLLTAFRNLFRNKVFSFINIFGLAIGLAASLMIAMWVFDELSYDRFHENADRIYRVERDIFYQGQSFMAPVTGAIYGPTLRDKFPDVMDFVRVDPMELSVETHNKQRFSERIMFADSSFLSVFTFPLQQGNPSTALSRPASVVLSRPAVKKYFGNGDPLNKILKVELDNELVELKVTGVFDDLPQNKHFAFDMVASFPTLDDWYGEDQLKNWVSNYLYTYILLKEDTDMEHLEGQLEGLVQTTILPAYAGFFNSDGSSGGEVHLNLRPLPAIHLRSGLIWDIEVQGDMMIVYVFSVVALLILLIASCNFMSLSTAQAGRRSLEVGIRKTLGSNRGQLIRQFIGESMLITIIAFVFALLLIQLGLQEFNVLTGKNLSMRLFLQADILFAVVAIILFTGVLSGIYPAFYLSSFRPIAVLKGRLKQKASAFSFRQVLVLVQFSISIVLIIGSITALQQLSYMQSKPLGYNKDNLMILPVNSNTVSSHYEVFRDELLRNPVISSVSASQRTPAERNYSDTGWETDIQTELFLSIFFSVDFDFFDAYQLEMAAGRPFNRKFATDKQNKYIINQTAVKKLGYSSDDAAIGEKFHSQWLMEESGFDAEGEIIGVVRDFHFKSMKNKIEPLALFVRENWINRISVRYQEGMEEEAIALAGACWKKHFPDVDFSYSFLDDYLTAYYKAEQKLQTILLIFTLLAILIACMGLFGLAMFIAQQKVKEIGVRKALGASTVKIVLMLTKTFTRWVVLANLIAWPLAWYLLSEWLNGFEYRIRPDIIVFIMAGLIALAIAVLTIMQRSFIAASRNPVEALRYE